MQLSELTGTRFGWRQYPKSVTHTHPLASELHRHTAGTKLIVANMHAPE